MPLLAPLHHNPLSSSDASLGRNGTDSGVIGRGDDWFSTLCQSKQLGSAYHANGSINPTLPHRPRSDQRSAHKATSSPSCELRKSFSLPQIAARFTIVRFMFIRCRRSPLPRTTRCEYPRLSGFQAIRAVIPRRATGFEKVQGILGRRYLNIFPIEIR